MRCSEGGREGCAEVVRAVNLALYAMLVSCDVPIGLLICRNRSISRDCMFPWAGLRCPVLNGLAMYLNTEETVGYLGMHAAG